MQDVSDLYLLMEETERQAVRRALLEERGRYCSFISLLQPVVVGRHYVYSSLSLSYRTSLSALVCACVTLLVDTPPPPPATIRFWGLYVLGGGGSWNI